MCVSFHCTAKWIHCTCTYFPLFQISFPFRSPQSTEYSSLSYIVWGCLITQSYPTLCNPVDCSPPGSSVQGYSRQEYWSGLPFPSPLLYCGFSLVICFTHSSVYGTTDWFPIGKGVCQGCVLAPCLFNLLFRADMRNSANIWEAWNAVSYRVELI